MTHACLHSLCPFRAEVLPDLSESILMNDVTAVEKVEVLNRSFTSVSSTRIMLKCLVQINVPDSRGHVRRVKVKVKVLVSLIDRNNSYGHAQVFSLDELKWNPLASLACGEMDSRRTGSKEEDFQKDCDALIEMAKKILL